MVKLFRGIGDMADIFGTGGNDTLTGTSGDDNIYTLGGADTVNAGDGDDTVVLLSQLPSSGALNGGLGIDTLRIDAAAVPFNFVGPYGAYALNLALLGGTTIVSFERFAFNSSAGSVMSAQLAFGGNGGALNQIGGGLAANSEIIGGAGYDQLNLNYNSANLPGTVTAPSFTYTNWTTPTRAYLGGDRVSIAVNGSGATTINGSAHAGVQGLSGGTGDDVVNGSDDMDYIIGGVGNDQLHGGGGNDALVVANSYFISNGVANAETTRTGAGSLFDGGTGTDFLVLGGNVNFLGTIQSIEGIYLTPGYVNTNATGQFVSASSQYNTRAVFSSATFAPLPTNLELDGAGTIIVNLGDAGETFTGAGFTFDPGSNVLFEIYGGNGTDTITGTSQGDLLSAGLGNDTLFGGDGDDTIVFGIGNQTAAGGAGADRFRPGLVQGVVTDFTIGTDKIDFSDTDISNMGRARDLLTQGAGGATLSADTGGLHLEMVLQGVGSASLTDGDFLLGSPNQGPYFESGTAVQDYLYGGSFNDQLHGGDGNDRIYGGGGVDQLFGDGGDDTIILDGATSFGGTYDGGAGTDTLLLRANATSVANGPATSYFIFPGAPGTGLVSVERVVFDSSASYALTFVTTTNPGITEAVGGAGVDTLVFVATSGGIYTMPSFTLTNWSANDVVALVAQTGTVFNVTLNGRNDIGQYLGGQLGADTLNGGAMADTLSGGGGADILSGGAGNDRLLIGSGSDGSSIYGGADTDTLAVSGTVGALAAITGIEAVEFSGGASLTLTGSQFNTGLAAGSTFSGTGTLTISMDVGIGFSSRGYVAAVGSAVALVVNGTSGTDIIKAGNFTGTFNGGGGNDQINGGAQVDTINGGDGNDKIMGFGGADILTGGAGSDTFRFGAATDSGIGVAADRITDFVSGTDKLGFTLIDTDPIAVGDQGFTFIGSAAFSATDVSEMRYMNSGADLLVQADIDGDGIADMEVVLAGLAGQTLTGGDFLL
jgi:Ca2+-binding RTX toxin-like protein